MHLFNEYLHEIEKYIALGTDQVVHSIGAKHFLAIASDGAANEKIPHLSICEKILTLIRLYDAAHVTHLPCKDNCWLPIFTLVRKVFKLLYTFHDS